jgi:DNA-binding winged helix-turn-helix (wHTH) protein
MPNRWFACSGKHEQSLEQKRTLSDPLIGLRQVSVTLRVDACDPGTEQERGTPNASAVGGPPRNREEYDTAAVGPPALRGKIASFGPFRLHATERLLEKNGTPLKLGSRALDILITLLEHAPEVVSKRDLIRRVWGQLVVDEVSLPVHVHALRKRLGDGDSSVSYIRNIPGRGYCFTGEVTWAEARATSRKAPAAQLFVRQVAHSGHAFELTDTDAPIVAEICRRLDDIALALVEAAQLLRQLRSRK